MNAKVLILVSALAAGAVFAMVMLPFQGWPRLRECSADIVVARCMKTALPVTIVDDVVESEIQVVMVLKGTNRVDTSTLLSERWLRQGEHYLVFGNFQNGSYRAIQEYRVVPLGVWFSTNSISGKPLDEQIQILLKKRLWQLNRELEQGREEKKRLEEGLPGP